MNQGRRRLLMVVGVVGVVCLVLVGLGVLLRARQRRQRAILSGMNWNPLYVLRDPLQPADLPLIEEGLGLDLPDVGTVRKIAMFGAQDHDIYLLLEVVESDAMKSLQVVKSRSVAADVSRKFPPGYTWGVPWYRCPPEDQVSGVYDDPNGFVFAFCVPNDGKVRILVRTYGPGTRDFSAGFYDLFTNEVTD